MREQYMRSGEGFLLVYSITSRSSFAEIATFHRQVLRVKDRDYFPMVMVANKCDLESERQVSTAGMYTLTYAASRLCVLLTLSTEGYAMARSIGCPFVETSAKQRVNVDEAFNDLVREIRRFMREETSYRGVSSQEVPGQNGMLAADSLRDSGVDKSCCKGCVMM